MSSESAQKEWQEKTYSFAAALNDYVRRGLKEGWDKVGKAPKDPKRKHLTGELLKAIREANTTGKLAELRENWPPAHRP